MLIGMPIDNTDIERLIRDMVMGKKSYLFCRDLDACRRAAMMYSLFGACKVLGKKKTERWLSYVLKNIKTTPRIIFILFFLSFGKTRDDKHELKFKSNQGVLPIGMSWWRAKPPMLVSKKAMSMPPCKVTALFETMQYGVHRILTF